MMKRGMGKLARSFLSIGLGAVRDRVRAQRREGKLMKHERRGNGVGLTQSETTLVGKHPKT